MILIIVSQSYLIWFFHELVEVLCFQKLNFKVSPAEVLEVRLGRGFPKDGRVVSAIGTYVQTCDDGSRAGDSGFDARSRLLQ